MPTLEFKGKAIIYAHHLGVPVRVLTARPGKSVSAGKTKPNLDDNLIIEGDNLHALKALLPRFAARVNCIYIDPPYNTGNEKWAYNDNVNSPMMREWLKDKSPVDGEDLQRHDKWLCMMWPRLQLLRELLADDGVIFVSIDDNEQHRLRMVMDEIFGEENYRNLIVIRRGVKSVQRQFEKIDRLNFGCEYVLAYSKSVDYKFDHLTEMLQEVQGGSWNGHWRGTDRPTMRYEIFGQTPETGQWRWSKERSFAAIATYKRMLKEIGKPESKVSQDEIDDWYVSQDDDADVDLLRLSNTGKPEHYVPPPDAKYLSNLWSDLKPNGGQQLKRVFSNKVFDNPKSTDLIKRLIRFACGNNANAVILDSFAGSGTTAHATLALNAEDGGARKFILVECESYADTITAERVRRAIKGVRAAKDPALKTGLGGSFTYCNLGAEIDAEKMLTDKNLPAYEDLARHLMWTATGNAPAAIRKPNKDGLFCESPSHLFYLIYKPDREFLRSKESALTGDHADRIAAAAKRKNKPARVFATHRFIGQKELSAMNIEFCGIGDGV